MPQVSGRSAHRSTSNSHAHEARGAPPGLQVLSLRPNPESWTPSTFTLNPYQGGAKLLSDVIRTFSVGDPVSLSLASKLLAKLCVSNSSMQYSLIKEKVRAISQTDWIFIQRYGLQQQNDN